MKKVICFVTAIFIAVFLCLTAYATGDPNIDGGGGGTDTGTGENFWSVGNDGVRVTIVRESDKRAMTTPVDFSNHTMPDSIIYFGYVSKLKYSSGSSIVPALGSKYNNLQATTPIAQIISPSGGINISAVKLYFSDEGNLRDICEQIGFKFDDLISGKYVIMLEPIAYFTYNGVKHAMTATEAALFDQKFSGELKNKMGFLTHQNLPLAMFLEKPDIGYPAWSGATSGIRANSEIISSLGIGSVRFADGACCNHKVDCPCIIDIDKPNDCSCKKEHPDTPCKPDTPGCDCIPEDGANVGLPDYEYRTDTDVITSFYIYDRTGNKDGVNPDMNAKVSINVNGTTYTKSYVVPPNESTLVWFKWHTPKTEQKINIPINISGGGSIIKSSIVADITELVEKTPPDTQPTDLKPYQNWQVPRIPTNTSIQSLNWGEWEPWWFVYLVWFENLVFYGGDCDCPSGTDCTGGHGGDWVDEGYWVDKGWWEYDWIPRSADVIGTFKINPDERVPTAIKKSDGKFEIKSGYGVNITADGKVFTSGNSDDITPFQNTVAIFPEFDYKQYNRVLDKKVSFFNTSFQLKVNTYSRHGSRSHFTPIWFPDRKQYAPQIISFDAWCPMGQLYIYDSDYVHIMGDVYDDWNISPQENE